MHPETLLTISIPTWNRSGLVYNLAMSLITQIEVYNLETKIEILISDNGSDDDTQEVLKPLIKYPFFSYYRNSINLGARANVLMALQKAKGKYAMFLGDDDKLSPVALSVLINFFENHSNVAALIDISRAKHNSLGYGRTISLNELILHYYWYVGNAGLFVLASSFIKEVLNKIPYENFSLSWPQTQLLILACNWNEDQDIFIDWLNLIEESSHSQVMIYSSHYLWRTCHYDLYQAIESISDKIPKSLTNSAKKYLSNNSVQVFNNILQCGVFVDNRKERHQTAFHILKHLKVFNVREIAIFSIATVVLLLPVVISRPLSNVFIFMSRGKKGLTKKNAFVVNERKKKSRLLSTPNRVIRSFQFE
jgi:glycosyltransferase involved in cell wall biosynthesis